MPLIETELKEQVPAVDSELTDKGLMWSDVYVSGAEDATGVYATRKVKIGQLKGVFSKPIDGTFAELKAIQDAGLLDPNDGFKVGCYYLMTDFQTIFDQPDYDASGAPKTTVLTKTCAVSPIMTLAISPTEFAKEIHRPSTPKQILHYDFDFVVTEYMGAPAKGRITYCKDENGNETTYDHTNDGLLLKRYESTSGSGVFDSYKDTGFASTQVLTFGEDSSHSKILGWSAFNGYNNFLIPNISANTAIDVSIGVDSENSVVTNNFWNSKISSEFVNNIIDGYIVKTSILIIANCTINGGIDNCVGSSILNCTINGTFQNNTIDANINGVDFSTATHVYAEYPCRIFKLPNGTLRLSYIDDSGVLQVVNPTD